MANRFLFNLKELLRISGDAPVLMSVKDKKIYVGAHTYYHSIILESPMDMPDFTTVIEGKSAQQVSRSMTSTRFSITHDSGIVFSSVGVKLSLPVLESDLSINKLAAKFSKDETHTVLGEALASAVKRIKHAANDTSIGDVVLRGYHMTTTRDSIEFMSSNGAVLAVTKIEAETESEGVILLNPEFHQVASLFSEEKVSIRQGKDTISFESKTSDERVIRVVSNLTYGEPISYSDVVSSVQQNPISLEINSRNFNNALKAGGFFTDDDHNNRVSLKISQDDIEIHASNAKGHAVATVEPDTSTGVPENGLTVITGYTNLAGFLANSSTATIELRLKDSNSPMYFTDGVVHGVSVLFFK